MLIISVHGVYCCISSLLRSWIFLCTVTYFWKIYYSMILLFMVDYLFLWLPPWTLSRHRKWRCILPFSCPGTCSLRRQRACEGYSLSSRLRPVPPWWREPGLARREGSKALSVKHRHLRPGLELGSQRNSWFPARFFATRAQFFLYGIFFRVFPYWKSFRYQTIQSPSFQHLPVLVCVSTRKLWTS